MVKSQLTWLHLLLGWWWWDLNFILGFRKGFNFLLLVGVLRGILRTLVDWKFCCVLTFCRVLYIPGNKEMSTCLFMILNSIIWERCADGEFCWIFYLYSNLLIKWSESREDGLSTRATLFIIMWTKFEEKRYSRVLCKTSCCSIIYSSSGCCLQIFNFSFSCCFGFFLVMGKVLGLFCIYTSGVMLVKVISTCFCSFSCLSLLNLIWKCKWGGGEEIVGYVGKLLSDIVFRTTYLLIVLHLFLGENLSVLFLNRNRIDLVLFSGSWAVRINIFVGSFVF